MTVMSDGGIKICQREGIALSLVLGWEQIVRCQQQFLMYLLGCSSDSKTNNRT